MQFGSADWSFLPIEFECVQTVWLFIKMSDWPFLRNIIECVKFRQNFPSLKNFPVFPKSFQILFIQ